MRRPIISSSLLGHVRPINSLQLENRKKPLMTNEKIFDIIMTSTYKSHPWKETNLLQISSIFRHFFLRRFATCIVSVTCTPYSPGSGALGCREPEAGVHVPNLRCINGGWSGGCGMGATVVTLGACKNYVSVIVPYNDMKGSLRNLDSQIPAGSSNCSFKEHLSRFCWGRIPWGFSFNRLGPQFWRSPRTKIPFQHSWLENSLNSRFLSV